MAHAPSSRAWPVRAADLQGLSQLAIDGVIGVTGIVEAMHGAIAPTLLPAERRGRTRGISRLAYGAVRQTTRGVGWCLGALWSALPVPPAESATSLPREAFIAALNGVLGDHLANTGNPLAIPMHFRIGGQPVDDALATLHAPTGRIVLLVHGLAMNDLQWARDGHDHGSALQRDAGFTPVYLHYNSGRHVSQNGRELADRLDELVAHWPVPVEELVIIGHSMGGLVARSACHYGEGRRWRRRLSTLVFLGTPHHGAPLERGGRWIDVMLGVSRYAAPLARLGRIRSAGITDLRFGNVQDGDWQQHVDRHAQHHDSRVLTPLPKRVRCCFVAAVTGQHAGSLRSAAIGDGLVPLASALGEHKDPARTLHTAQSRRLVVTSANHWDLLSRSDVYGQLLRWLA